MKDIKQIVLASTNEGKIREFTQIFAEIGIEIIPQSIYNVPEVEEPFSTFIENALHKARNCSEYTGLPSLADDSGICVESLGGMPGIYSARFAGTPRSAYNNNHKLINELAKFKNKNAYFYCVLVLIQHKLDPQPIIADGIINGLVIDDNRGTNGHGYDPIFYMPSLNKTMAEIDSKIKNKISHRAIAIKNLLNKIKHLS